MDYVNVYVEDDELHIDIEGPWISTIWFEVPILAIVSEIHSRSRYMLADAWKTGAKNLKDKIHELHTFSATKNLTKRNTAIKHQPLRIADFGTRRRFTREWQEQVIEDMMIKIDNSNVEFVGTSNVMFAKQFDIKPIGTMAHEWFQGHQQQPNIQLSNHISASLESWVQEYRGDLGIALSDIVGFESFLRSFDMYFMKLFDGCRHDSGSPFDWGNQLIDHYQANNIDARTKTAVFSDGLDISKCIELYYHFASSIQLSFGVGTNLTNDMGVKALQIVIKMVECNHGPVAKMPDSIGKGMCEDKSFESYLRKVCK